MGYHIKKTHSTIILGAIGILCLDLVVEIELLPLLYRGIPLPFIETGKPIGAALIPAAFFNVLLTVANVFGFAYLLQKAGFDLGLIPKTRNDWLDIMVLLTFLISGVAMWYFPIFFLPLVITGFYLVAAHLS